VSPILGIWASQNYPRSTTAYESIATVTVGSGGSASISFTSSPATYTHLQVRCLARTDRALTADQLRITVNSDSASNYSDHILSGDGSSATASAAANNTYMFLGRASAATATASIFGATIIDILDYANTNKYKTLRSLTGVDFNGTGNISLTSGSWRNTAAITSIQVTFLGSLMDQYSSFALYGIKG
jgi:hypothetical protein